MMKSVYRQTIGPNYVSNGFYSWLTDTLLLESRSNPSTPEILESFQNYLTINQCDLYQRKLRVGCKLSCITYLQTTRQTINTLLATYKTIIAPLALCYMYAICDYFVCDVLPKLQKILFIASND